jgi:hypothetical protein
LLAAALLLTGCAASYKDRMNYLDTMTRDGLTYRTQLQKQGTQPSDAACTIGWNLLQAQPPDDTGSGTPSDTWLAQVKEAYVKACISGEARPKPEPSGINAVTPVPFPTDIRGSVLPPTPTPSSAT